MADNNNDLYSFLKEQAYKDITTKAKHGVCAISAFMFTYGLIVDLTFIGYDRRYCYKTYQEAKEALDNWGNEDHPPGNWIKCKGSCGDITKQDIL